MLPTTLSTSSLEKSERKTCVINVVDGLSYDTALRCQTIFGRHVIIVSVHTLLHAFATDILANKIRMSEFDEHSVDKNMSENIIETIKMIGYSKITLNFECCSGYGFGTNGVCDCADTLSYYSDHPHYYFVNKNISKCVIFVISHMLKYGTQVICSDFAAKALIFNWDCDIFGSVCPFTIIGTSSGSIHVKYIIDECKNCPFPQLAALSSVAIPDIDEHQENQDDQENQGQGKEKMKFMTSSCVMDAMTNTIIYGINPEIDESLDLKVYSVATQKINDEITSISPQILKLCKKQKSESEDMEPTLKKAYTKLYASAQRDDEKTVLAEGFPVHTVVIFKDLSGSLVVSSLHLSNLTDVKTSFEKVTESATLYLGPQRSYELGELLKQTSLQKPELVRSVTSSIVSEIIANAH